MWADPLHRGGLMVEKPFTTIPEQIDLLRARGMPLDPNEVSRWLVAVDYHRTSWFRYFYRMQSIKVI